MHFEILYYHYICALVIGFNFALRYYLLYKHNSYLTDLRKKNKIMKLYSFGGYALCGAVGVCYGGWFLSILNTVRTPGVYYNEQRIYDGNVASLALVALGVYAIFVAYKDYESVK